VFTGSPPRRRLPRPARGPAAVICLALAASVLTQAPAAAAAVSAFHPLSPQRDASVPGTDGGVTPFAADPAAAAARRVPAAAVWPSPGSVTVDVAGAGAAARAGSLPVSVGPARGVAVASDAPSRVRVSVVDAAGTARAGRPEVLLRVARADGAASAGRVRLRVDYRGFASAFGGDWSNRLRLVALPECALSSPDRRECVGTPVESVNDGRSVTGEVTASAQTASSSDGALFALAAGSSGSTGSFAATSLSASSSWQAGGPSGDFSWSYPLRVPPSLNGPAPTLALSYSAQSVDGRTPASNNQPSWVGEGFEMWSGYIERSYTSCSDDMGGDAINTTKTGDECWGTDNATMSLNGGATELVRDDATGAWHPRHDDGSRVEHLTDTSLGNGDNDGEYWRVTTANGTQYWFGRNHLPGWVSGKAATNSTWTVPVFGNNPGEPCHASTFDASWCQQAWRWNLDYVVDPHGNTMSFWYTTETNKYARNLDPATSTSYDRGGYLTRIDYGTRSDTAFGTAPMRVLFGVADRCLSSCTTHDAAHWPDTPWDLNCSSSCTTSSPSFWTTRRLSTVTTQVWRAATSSYGDVEQWTLTHTFPDPGDSTRAGLWLAGISHAGLVGGTTSVPDITFTGVQKANRVDTVNDQLPAMNWWRIAAIRTETGGEITVSYSGPDCVAGSRMPAADENNTLRCFPVWYTRDGADSPSKEYFHKYVVTAVGETDHTGGATRVLTSYTYIGSPAWHYTDDNGLTPPKQRTWSVWRGYGRVGVTKGDPGQQSYGETLYFRGMDGDHLPTGARSVSVTDSQGGSWNDTDALAGTPREEISYAGPGGPEVSGLITDPWLSNPTATRAANGTTVTARYVNTATTRQRIALDGGRGYRRTRTTTTYDSRGMPVQVDDLGDESTPDDDQCEKTTYARNTSAWLMSYVSRTETYAVSCDRAPASADDVIGDGRVSFDNQAWGVPPTKGDVTRIEALSDWAVDTGPTYYTVSRSAYDAYGRVTDSWDVDGNHSTTAYTPASGGPVTQTTATNPLGWVTTTDYEPAWGLELGETDPNGRRTDLAYDGLGRLTSVWLPGRNKGTQTPNTSYAYTVRTNGTVAVRTSALTPDGTYVDSYDLFDGLLRPRQTQDPAPGPDGGRIITDTFYDSAGRAYKANSAYATNGAPSADLFTPAGDNAIPSQTLTLFDGADRPTATVLRSLGVEKWRTTTAYGGDRVDVTPPAGGTATSTLTDGRGRTVELRQYRGGTPTGPYDATRYAYGRKNVLATVTDPAGNTWTYTYDLRGRKTRVDDPDQGTQTMTYNDDGTLATVTDSRGTTLAYTYDTLNRKTAEYLGSTTGTKLAEWTYDTLAKGQLTSSTRYDNGNAYTTAVTSYTADYQPRGTTVTIPAAEGALAGTYTYSMTYKVDGSPSTTTVPAAGGLPQETLGYGYDALGEPLTLAGTTSYVTNTQYTRLGEPNIVTYSLNGPDGGPIAQVGYYYEEATRRLDQQKTVRETAPSTVSDVDYTWDPSGNLTKVADSVSGDTQCFTYDYLSRIAQAWTPKSGVDCGTSPSTANLGGPAPYWQSYTYNLDGGRRQLVDHSAAGDTTTTYTYPAAGAAQPHTLLSTSTTGPAGTTTASYGYDSAGNTTSRPGPGGNQTLTWDAEGHLATVTDSTGTTTYLYDANGERLIARDPTGTTLYLPGQELRLTKATGTVSCTRYYTHGGTTVASRTPSGVTWLAPDWQGTDTTAIDAVSQQVTQRRQTPFGTRRGSAVNWPNPHGFVGGVNDATGLVHLGAREYDPGIGRFVSVDPLIDTGDPQQMEGYTYSDNNPTTNSDPSGQMWKRELGEGGFGPAPYHASSTSSANAAEHGLEMNLRQFGSRNPGYPPPRSQPAPHHPHKQKKCSSWNLGCKAKKAVHATVNWVDDHKAVIAGVAAGIAAGVACEIATGGVGSVGCLALAGAVGSMVQYTVETAVEHKGSFSWGGLLLNGAIGAAAGVVFGGAGKLATSGLRAVAARVGSAEIKKRAVAAVEGGLENLAAYSVKTVRRGQKFNWANAAISTASGAATSAAFPAGGVTAGAWRAGGADVGIQMKDVAVGNTDHYSAGESALAFGYGALGGKLVGGATRATPKQYAPGVRSSGAVVWRSYNPSDLFHNLLP
jgi:RHS repeat-associated protein